MPKEIVASEQFVRKILRDVVVRLRKQAAETGNEALSAELQGDLDEIVTKLIERHQEEQRDAKNSLD